MKWWFSDLSFLLYIIYFGKIRVWNDFIEIKADFAKYKILMTLVISFSFLKKNMMTKSSPNLLSPEPDGQGYIIPEYDVWKWWNDVCFK